ncbi:MAG: glycosyltransferase, partial [Clostridium sp.]|uniref:glycosyltransferase n=1 Tax=Clostridium sp. TaxID=1506 RepID=UPI0029066016
VVIEAFSNKIPVIALNYGAISNIIDDGENGYLANDIETFVTRSIDLIENKELRQKMGERAFKKVMIKYNSKINNEKINKLLSGNNFMEN